MIAILVAAVVIVVLATGYWRREIRRRHYGFPESRNRGRYTYMAWISGKF